MSLSKKPVIYTLFILFLVLPGFAFANEINTQPTTTPNGDSEKITNTNQQLIELVKSIETTQKELNDVKATLSTTKDELDIKALTEQRDELDTHLQDLQKNFNAIAIGSIDVSAFEKKTDAKPFNWQEELKDVIQPILDELKRLTEKPRAIEKLRTEKAALEAKLPIATNAIENIGQLKINTDDAQLSQYLIALEESWNKRLTEVNNRLRLVSFQLEDKLNPPKEAEVSLGEQIKSFLTGRGLNIAYAVAAFLLIYSFLKLISKLAIKSIEKKKNQKARIFKKAIQISFRLLSISLAILAVMLVFYIRGDWVLFGLGLLVLLGLAWTLRQSVPGYITEAKLILNFGPVRENERVVYNGIPWHVSAVNFYSTLTNPELTGGELRLPAHVILELQSRPFDNSEAWFPCQPGDYIVLDDDYYGSVLLQTPEVVNVRVRGGNTKTYATTDFLALNPRNLSHGFGLFITFGFDYDDQKSITEDIPQKLQNYLAEAISSQPFGEHVKSFKVEFHEAGASTLDLLIIATFKGEAADNYYGIKRFIQRTTVEACNQYNWNIPFNQLTVHMANNN